jgi:hypothetical protein
MNDLIRAEQQRITTESAEALALYRLIRQVSPRPHPLVEYRCDGGRSGGKSGCLLAAVYGSPRGEFVYAPCYRYSAEEAQRQGLAPDRRAFPERAYMLDQIPVDRVMRSPVMACRHRVLILLPVEIHADVAEAKRSRRLVRGILPDARVTATVLR